MLIYTLIITFVLGGIIGFAYCYYKTVDVTKQYTAQDMVNFATSSNGAVPAMASSKPPEIVSTSDTKGEFILVNETETYLKENLDKEVALGDILKEE